MGAIIMFIIVFSIVSQMSREDARTKEVRERAEALGTLYYIDGRGKARLTSTGQEVIPSHRGMFTVFDEPRKCLLDKHLNVIMWIDWEYLKDLNETSKKWFAEHGYRGYIKYDDPRDFKLMHCIEYETGLEYKPRLLSWKTSGECRAEIEYLDYKKVNIKDKEIFSMEEYDSYCLFGDERWWRQIKRLEKKWCFN